MTDHDDLRSYWIDGPGSEPLASEPRIEIERVGRWSYRLHLYPHAGDLGWIGLDAGTALTLRGACRLSRRLLGAYREPVAIETMGGPEPTERHLTAADRSWLDAQRRLSEAP